MKRSNAHSPAVFCRLSACWPRSSFLMGADEPKQTIDAKGLTFEAPKAWKSSTPSDADAPGPVESRADRG